MLFILSALCQEFKTNKQRDISAVVLAWTVLIENTKNTFSVCARRVATCACTFTEYSSWVRAAWEVQSLKP